MINNNSNKNIVIITGEQSGNNLIYPLIEILSKSNSYNIFCVADEDVAKLDNVKLIMDRREFSVMGFYDVIKNINNIRKNMNNLKKEIVNINPDIVVLVDSPDLNLRMAKFIKNRIKSKIVYVVSPTIWAWRYSRIYTVKKYVDIMTTIFPFEVEYYKKENIIAEYIGHPFYLNREFDEISNSFNKDNSVIGVFPGSRNGELQLMVNSFASILQKIYEKDNSIKFIVSRLKSVDQSLYEPFNKIENVTYSYDKFDILKKSSFLFVKSGTVTMDALFSKKPFFIFYKTNKLNYFLVKFFANKNLKYIGMPNILSNKEMFKEYIQYWDEDKIVKDFFDNRDNSEYLNKIEEVFKFLPKKNYIDSLMRIIEENI